MANMIFLVFRAFFITMMTVGMMATLTEFRFGRRKLLLILAVYGLWVIGSSMVLLWLGGELLLLRLFYLTISIPATVLTYWAANDTPVQAVFNHMTQILLSVLVVSIIRLLTDYLDLAGFVNVLLMGAFYLTIIYLERRFLRQPFRVLIQIIPTRWGVLTLIPCVFCAYFIFVASWPGSYLQNDSQIVYVYAAVIPLIIVYIAVFKSLYDLYRIQVEQHSAALLAVQITALKEKLQKVKEVEEGIRIQRHDLRHQLQTVTELVAQGDRDAALKFLDAAQTRLDEHTVTRWCRPPVLDAVFSSYFDQAKNNGIPVEARISLSDTLSVDEGELAIVLANALENAIHANLELPRDQRKILCKIVGSPSVMLEISNPCTDNISFDSNGLPVAQREGHGLGVQSISAFCRKNRAICQFDLADGWFRFRLIL
ncbi:sensor histidine kinase [Pseudoflavonifractor phocaeensis]|uniref:sensor histidine kinase n=1 Tax=Pseudoflavonifractor phocaeensis TaxID=1870988 RepID=UPI0019561242|nr:GHKL domain-containing protein [Pseudoflavonifractor phocaeensis]MBM6924666.1 GHKL domain-containing protein [Pseudoflavonifractor phocaeensis]